MNFELLKTKALAKGITDIEIYTHESFSTEIKVTDFEIEQKSINNDRASYVRGVYNNQLVGYCTENLEDSEVDKIVDYLVSVAPYVSSDDPFLIYEGDKDYHEVKTKEFKLAKVSIKEKIDFLLNLNKKIKELTENYFHVSVYYAEGYDKFNISNTKGLNLENEGNSAVIYLDVNLKKGDDVKSAFKVETLTSFDDLDFDELCESVVKEANDQFSGQTIKSSSYKVILHHDVVSSLLQAYSGAFLANVLKKKMSFLENKVDTKVFGDNITIYDDPFNDKDYNQRAFDDEGVKTRVTTVVENGVFKTFLYNLSTAIYYNTESTGNGFKSGLASPVGVGFNRITLKEGTTSYEDLITKLDNGIIITDVSGLHAGINPLTGDFNLQSAGYLVEEGKIKNYINLFVTSGNFIDLLNNIVEIGSDVKVASGTSTPSLLVKSLNISGE